MDLLIFSVIPDLGWLQRNEKHRCSERFTSLRRKGYPISLVDHPKGVLSWDPKNSTLTTLFHGRLLVPFRDVLMNPCFTIRNPKIDRFE
jgi:hypothetical protein